MSRDQQDFQDTDMYSITHSLLTIIKVSVDNNDLSSFFSSHVMQNYLLSLLETCPFLPTVALEFRASSFPLCLFLFLQCIWIVVVRCVRRKHVIEQHPTAVVHQVTWNHEVDEPEISRYQESSLHKERNDQNVHRVSDTRHLNAVSVSQARHHLLEEKKKRVIYILAAASFLSCSNHPRVAEISGQGQQHIPHEGPQCYRVVVPYDAVQEIQHINRHNPLLEARTERCACTLSLLH